MQRSARTNKNNTARNISRADYAKRRGAVAIGVGASSVDVEKADVPRHTTTTYVRRACVNARRGLGESASRADSLIANERSVGRYLQQACPLLHTYSPPPSRHCAGVIRIGRGWSGLVAVESATAWVSRSVGRFQTAATYGTYIRPLTSSC